MAKRSIAILSTHDNREEAWKAVQRMAAEIVKRKMPKTYSVGMVRKRGSWWVELYESK